MLFSLTLSRFSWGLYKTKRVFAFSSLITVYVCPIQHFLSPSWGGFFERKCGEQTSGQPQVWSLCPGTPLVRLCTPTNSIQAPSSRPEVDLRSSPHSPVQRSHLWPIPPFLPSARCFKQIWKLGRAGKVSMVGKVDKVGKVGKVDKVGREG